MFFHTPGHDFFMMPSWADAIMGVNFFGEIAPDDFGSYDLAFVTVFSMTAGNSWVFFKLFEIFDNACCFAMFACTPTIGVYSLLLIIRSKLKTLS